MNTLVDTKHAFVAVSPSVSLVLISLVVMIISAWIILPILREMTRRGNKLALPIAWVIWIATVGFWIVAIFRL
jgi:hypothetical protein